MSAILAPEPPTILAAEGDDLFEIVDEQRIEVPPMSFLSNFVANKLAYKLNAFADGKTLGFCVVECLFRMALPVNRHRRPDLAFVSTKRWPADKPFPKDDNVLDIVPDLMAEVVSPSDLAEDLFDKVHEYFEAGAAQVWIVLPRRAEMQIFDGPRSSRWLGRDDVLENIPFLPSFRLPLIDVFGPAETA